MQPDAYLSTYPQANFTPPPDPLPVCRHLCYLSSAPPRWVNSRAAFWLTSRPARAHPRGDPVVVAAEHLGGHRRGRALPDGARTRRQPRRGAGRTAWPGDARRLRQATGASAGSHRQPRQGAVAASGGPAAWRLGMGPRRLRTAPARHPAAEPQPLQPGAARECDLLFPVFDPAVRTPSRRSTEATPCPGFRPPHSLSAIITAPRRQP